MERALYLSGAHVIFKQPVSDNQQEPATRKLRIPVPKWRKRKMERKTQQRIIGGIALDPIDRMAAIVTSKTPKDCKTNE
jgi:hypothetical protein